MSIENLKVFQEKILKDPNLQEQIKVAVLKEKPESEKVAVETILIPIATTLNLPFSLEDYQALKEKNQDALTEEELETISGGMAEGVAYGVCFVVGVGTGECGMFGDPDHPEFYDDNLGIGLCIGIGI